MTTELVELADRLQLHAVIQRRRRYPENAALADEAANAIRALASRAGGWRTIESAPIGTNVLAWLHLPKNPIASACVIAQRVDPDAHDGPEFKQNERRTPGCWWANGRYYPAGHVIGWQPLPAAPEPVAVGPAIAPGCGDGVGA